MSQDPTSLSRRLFLKGGTLAACSAAAWPLATPITFASAPGEGRLVVIILRGAMDGLDLLRPVGDPAFAALRSETLLGKAPGLDLDGFFELTPALEPLMPMWRAGSLGFAHAVATPYRDKRSHFDGQDILEAGTGQDVLDSSVRDGWLNRMIGALPGTTSQTAYAIGMDQLKVLAGDAPVMQWHPERRLDIDAQSRRLLEQVYEEDPLFHESADEAFAIADRLAGAQTGDTGDNGIAGVARFTAERLREEARIAAFSINGWDSHRGQVQVLRRQYAMLAEALTTLEASLGPETWGKTAVLAMTEFGRTARENGSGGTDHGTGGAMVMAGGAVAGRKVHGDWPGLSESALYNGRDLMPTRDVRAYAGWAMRGLFGLDAGLIESRVFPGLDLGSDPKILA